MKITHLLLSLCALSALFAGSNPALNFSATSARQSNGGFTIEQALSSPFPSDLVAAPTGTRIAWAFDAEGKRNVWGAEGPDFKARQLTRYDEDTGQELSSLQFTHDGKWVVYVRGGDANTSGEIPNPTSDPMGVEQAIHAVSFADGRTIKLANGDAPAVSPVNNLVVFNKDGQIHLVEIAEGSEPHPLFAARGTNASPRWSPDGRRLAFVSNRGSHSLIGVFDAEKRSIRYLAPSVDRDSFPRWSPDGKRLAFIRQPARAARTRAMLEDTPDPWAIMIADAGTGEAKEVWRSGPRLEDSLPRIIGENVLQWTKSGSLILASEKDGWLRLYSISREITPPNCEVEHVTMTPDRKWLIYSSNRNEADRRAIWMASADATDPTPIKALTPLNKISWGPVVTGDGKYLAYLSSDERTPAMPFVMPLNGGAARMIASEALPPEFPASKLVVPQPAIFKAADGQEIHGQLFLPPNAKPADKLPAVIFMHGGPMRQMLLGWHYMYYYHNTYAFNQYLASRGYAVLSVNFRAGIGYGRAFREAPKRGARGASEYQDVVAGANYLRSRADIDPSKIGLWGGSYGGYLTALGLARNSDLFAAGVD
ncbi:MAG: S9 family peptidase, partial [Blastocatellia bacterium]